MTRKKILVLLATPFYLNKGSCVTAKSMLTALGNTGYSVDLITYPVGDDIDINNVKIIRPKIPLYKKISAGPSLSKVYADILLFFHSFIYLLKNRKNYWIIVGEDCEGGFISLILSTLFRKKSVYQMYNSLNQTLLPYTKNKFILGFFKLIDYLLERYHKNISVEWHYEKERLKKKYYNKNIGVIYDAFPQTIKKPDNVNLKEDDYIVYAGNFKDYQGIPLFLDKFEIYLKENPHIRLILIGDGYKEIEKIAKKKKLEKNILFTGALGLEETNYLIKNSLFCILPRIIDGPPGIKALHYFSQGKSILGTDLSCNYKLIKNNCTGLLVSKSNLFSGIKRLVEDKKLRMKLEKNIQKEMLGNQLKTNQQMQQFLENIK